MKRKESRAVTWNKFILAVLELTMEPKKQCVVKIEGLMYDLRVPSSGSDLAFIPKQLRPHCLIDLLSNNQSSGRIRAAGLPRVAYHSNHSKADV